MTAVSSAAQKRESAAGSKTLDGGVRILKLLADHPDGLTTSEVSSAVGLHRTVVYRLLGTLMTHRFVARDGSRYRIGLGVVELCRGARPNLQAAAAAHLTSLANEFQATAFITVVEGDDAVSVQVVEPRNSHIHVTYRVGMRHPATRGAPGIAVLSAHEPRVGEREAIKRARRLGYAVSTGELQPGAWGLAAPIRVHNRPVDSSVGVVALQALDEKKLAPRVVATADAIARQLA